ncbi:hypothetical protein MOQ_006664 [Trypanosoma cruzi marinkellei]|uniref:Uncharacterized protein n=1 Tax=Trypanosoma cruzi marinkellei TaxID=85056 RepID=K2NKY7_TRYCR|nr:hypothetical protein MOQ_006664 [Trypanosoma cruzi marinkellei]
MARSLPQDCANAWHVGFLTAVGGPYGREAQEVKEGAHTAWQVLVGVARAPFPVSTWPSSPRVVAPCAGAMRLLPTLRQVRTRPADYKQPLFCSCRPSLSETTGPPRPPPATFSDVTAANPCRPADGGFMSSCPICGGVRSSVHNTTAHARRARPGVPILGEGPACGRRNGSTVFLTGAFRALRRRRAKHASRQDTREAQTRVSKENQALSPPLHRRHVLRIPRRTTGDSVSSVVGMPRPLEL